MHASHLDCFFFFPPSGTDTSDLIGGNDRRPPYPLFYVFLALCTWESAPVTDAKYSFQLSKDCFKSVSGSGPVMAFISQSDLIPAFKWLLRLRWRPTYKGSNSVS